MNVNKIEKYREQLLQEKKEIIDTIHKIEADHEGTLRDSTGELSSYDNHPADLGTETFMLEQNINLKDREKMILTKIDLSLNNIEEGKYGNCIICGKPIEEDRLDIIPYTVTCKDHRDEVEQFIISERPIEEEFLQGAFSRTNNDDSEENFVGTDGEDIIQKLEEYNKIDSDPSHSTGDRLGIYDEKEVGSVEDIELISEEYYRGQFRNENREDIPDEQKHE
ncbi:TraR/DksA C4-type zinc finger protein [Clostridium sp. D2Q-14]|uniref:TraR/DksA C4-type zinc finger protein n=1 Tax=Anaeromonas gelatinilytica TaxID=2683194 RepID=UPI00193C0968|nr:TraR/DksA C4-type zinc finger protein [Anaeromonas gelatinilytica]MBS4534199.1 TraR/DksA C4-type zinc finger protein [Anaeromonas gelatinilytica]